MYSGKAFFSAFALTAAVMLQGCGGGSDSTEPTPPAPIPPATPPVAQTGDFELIAGTLDATAPAGAPRYRNGPALGVDLAPQNTTVMAVGTNGHIYLLKLLDRYATQPPQWTPITEMDLIEIDPSTGLMQVQQVPYNPNPERSPNPPYGYVQPSVTKVFDPSSFTIASDGSALIGDGAMNRGFPAPMPDRSQPGYGFGIWRFKDGVLSKLAGFDTPSESDVQGQDGKGGAATFASVDELCAGPDGAVYVNDNYAARRVLPDGTVQTLGDIVSFPQVAAYPTLICATNQRAVTRIVQDGKTVFTELSSGQIFGPGDTAALADLSYGFGNGLAISQQVGGGNLSVSIADLNTGTAAAAWIQYPYQPPAIPAFQLAAMPYVVPSPQIVIDNNDMAYLYSGNALLRYPLQKLQAN